MYISIIINYEKIVINFLDNIFREKVLSSESLICTFPVDLYAKKCDGKDKGSPLIMQMDGDGSGRFS